MPDDDGPREVPSSHAGESLSSEKRRAPALWNNVESDQQNAGMLGLVVSAARMWVIVVTLLRTYSVPIPRRTWYANWTSWKGKG